MNKQLSHLLLKRYGKFLVAIIVIVIGKNLLTTISSINQWQREQKVAFEPAENRKYSNFEVDENGKYLMTFYNGTVDKYTTDYVEFRDYQLTFFIEDWGSNHFGQYYLYDGSLYYDEFADFLIITCIIIGFSLFFFDLKTNFNTLLFSSRFSKKQIYWHKHLIVGGTLGLSLLIGKLMTVAGLWLAIPQPYMNTSFSALVNTGLFTVFLALSVYSISSIVGLLLGEWFTAVITLIGFWWTFPIFSNSLTDLFNLGYYFVSGGDNRYSPFYNPIGEFVFELTTTKVSFSLFILLLGVIILSLLIGAYWFKKTSLEANGHYLLFKQLQRPVLWLFILYCNITLNATPLAMSIYFNQNEPINVTGTLVNFTIVTLLSFLIGRAVIYRRFGFKRRAKQLIPA